MKLLESFDPMSRVFAGIVSLNITWILGVLGIGSFMFGLLARD